MKTAVVFVISLAILFSPLLGQDPSSLTWAPKPKTLPRYVAPHRPHTKLAELQAKHAGSQVVKIGQRPRGWVVVQPQRKKR